MYIIKKAVIAAAITGLLPFSALAGAPKVAITEAAVVENYGAIAYAVYTDALTTAKQLQSNIKALVDRPSQKTLDQARAAWIAARVPYAQSEVFRFGNSVVDEWEGQVNAWPLDEGLIDYVNKAQYHHEMGNAGANANMVANTSIDMGGTTTDLSKLTPEVLASLNEIGGSEANVATGYHAIEFLLWGQDLNGTKAGAGNRPFTDYVVGKECTHEHCDRRGEYIKSAAQLLVDDLTYMLAQWDKDGTDNYFAKIKNENPKSGLTKALFGMGSLALGEMAGDRMKVALTANSYEDEQDCFSDNTHYAHFYNFKGVENVYFGHYVRVDGTTLTGPSLADLVAQSDPALADATREQFAKTQSVMQAMVDAAENGSNPMKFDQMIAEGNAKGEALLENAIASLVDLTRQIEKVSHAVGIENLNPETLDIDF